MSRTLPITGWKAVLTWLAPLPRQLRGTLMRLESQHVLVDLYTGVSGCPQRLMWDSQGLIVQLPFGRAVRFRNRLAVERTRRSAA